MINYESVARKVLEVVDVGLCSGVGNPVPGQMCVEAAVCYAMGEPHGDQPSCVAPALRSFKINLNDKDWSSNKARAAGLRRIAIAQLGTKDTLDEEEFAKRLAKLTIQKIVPIALRFAAEKVSEVHKNSLLEMALLCESEPTEASARKAQAAANAAAYAANAAYAAYDAANAAAYDAAYDAANAAANAAYAAANAAYAAAYAAANATAYAANAAYAAEKDQILSNFAEDAVQILIDMETPGSKFLFLTEV